jgi:hypothetical protein
MAKKFHHNEQGAINTFAQFNTNLDEYIGKRVRFKSPICLAEKEEFEVRHIQNDHEGALCYNLIGTTEEHMGPDWIGSSSHQVGRPAKPEDIYFVTNE